jgi:aspartate/methionine/tyrosine aminotransferase
MLSTLSQKFFRKLRPKKSVFRGFGAKAETTIPRSDFDPLELAKTYYGTNPFPKYSTLCLEAGALNLAQGFPDYPILDILENSGLEALNFPKETHQPGRSDQFYRTFGKAVSQRLGRDIQDENMMVSFGCGGAYAAIVNANLNEGDEVILFEPFFLWHPLLENIGIFPKVARFKWDEENNRSVVDFDYLKTLITPKTKMITLINPNNPDGKIWTQEEIEALREICYENPQMFVIADETYNLFTYDGNQLVSIATVEGMWERTVTLYSCGKEMSCTGWRTGAAIGPDYLIRPAQEFLRWNHIQSASFTLKGLGIAYERAIEPYKGFDNFFHWKKNNYQLRKDTCQSAVTESSKLNLDVIPTSGGYTFIALIQKDIHKINIKYFYHDKQIPEGIDQSQLPPLSDQGGLLKFEDWKKLPGVELSPDQAFAHWSSWELGVTVIPGSYFFYNTGRDLLDKKGVGFVRFSVCKRLSVFKALREALA